MNNEEQRRHEEEMASDYDAFLKLYHQGRPWWYLIDQDERWIAKVNYD
jgi:hypothetical protein